MISYNDALMMDHVRDLDRMNRELLNIHWNYRSLPEPLPEY